MTELGTVIETEGETAQVKVGKHAECSACGACASAKNAVVTVSNKIGAKIGDRVKFETPDENILLGAFMVFMFPLVFTAIGTTFAYFFIFEYIIQTALFSFLISLLFVKMYDTYKGKELLMKSRIIEKI